MAWFGPQGDCGCCETPCKIWHGTLNETYSGFTFDTDWQLFGSISTENQDMRTVNDDTYCVNNATATGEAVLVVEVDTESDFTIGDKLRLIIGWTDDSNYLYLDITRPTGNINAQLGKVDTATDTPYGSAVEFDDVTTAGGTWKLCWSGAFLRGARDGATFQEEEDAAVTFGTRFGVQASDWTDANVIPLPMQFYFDDHDTERDGCPKCASLAGPNLLCCCSPTQSPVDFFTVTLASGQYVIPYIGDTVTERCVYYDEFEIGDCNCPSGFSGTPVGTDLGIRVGRVLSGGDPQSCLNMQVTFFNSDGGIACIKYLNHSYPPFQQCGPAVRLSRPLTASGFDVCADTHLFRDETANEFYCTLDTG